MRRFVSFLNQLSLFSQDFPLDIQYLKPAFQALHDACPLQDPGFTNRSRPRGDNHHRHPTLVRIELAYPRIQRTKLRRFDPPRHFIGKPKPGSVQVLCEPPRRRLRLTHITHISNGPRIRERVDGNAARAVTGIVIELRTNMATHPHTDRCLVVRVRSHLPPRPLLGRPSIGRTSAHGGTYTIGAWYKFQRRRTAAAEIDFPYAIKLLI